MGPAPCAFEFRISRQSRNRYGVDDTLFTLSGNVVLSNIRAVRLLAQRMNQERDVVHHPERSVRAGSLNAMGLIDEILHFILARYRRDVNPDLWIKGVPWLEARVGSRPMDETITRFVDLFPPTSVYRGEMGVQEYVSEESEGTPNLFVSCEELLLLSISNENPAFLVVAELFDDRELAAQSRYSEIISSMDEFFDTQPGYGPHRTAIGRLLREPMRASPYSLAGQLAYIREHWQSLLPPDLVSRLMVAGDVIKEEEKLGLLGPGPALVPRFGTEGFDEPERFSPELDWMPHVVLVAKNAYVWLHQLSKKYGRPIERLDQIPDEELDALARWGFTGLWLIGLWERSAASAKIKQFMGNPEALPSAYALFDYVIARDLGGEEAFWSLRERAWRRGIRMAGDMVPNHMGIDSRWVVEHPQWFMQLPYSPFPNYSFSGPNLSWDERVGLYMEDGYWNRTDAAVVFKRVDHWTGEERFIYHGNDGTSMPWNDTAQLNFLLVEVREAVIQTILHVARKFPIIRFDAAMTLAKRHYQRLWFPQPGTGGAIPSRAEHGLSPEAFEEAFPVEFWREVVDRIAREVPDTLLLAEAFWLMEGYFVRTLGMHRVYNSAFMNMFKMEDNANYRNVIKNILEFNPEILRRLVNFMNNPDEATAVEQFGKGDKYFGVAMMMVTMPGLPLFGHGQIEGFTEKYGMEYRRAYWEEDVDQHMVERHEREIFPLMRKRHLFSGVENFVLYDFFTPDGHVDENVFAFSNRYGNERALVLYHNKFATTRGWIRTSVAMPAGGGSQELGDRTLAEGLGIESDSLCFYAFRDACTGLEYLRQGRKVAEAGLYAELHAYQSHVFLDFREIRDGVEGYYGRLERELNGGGIPSVEEALQDMLLDPIHEPFRELVSPLAAESMAAMSRLGLDHPEGRQRRTAIMNSTETLFVRVQEYAGAKKDVAPLVDECGRLVDAAVRLNNLTGSAEWKKLGITDRDLPGFWYMVTSKDAFSSPYWGIAMGWLATAELGKIATERAFREQSVAWMDEYRLGPIIAQAFRALDRDDTTAQREVALIKILVTYRNWLGTAGDVLPRSAAVDELLSNPDVQRYLQFNRYDDVLWLSKERVEELFHGILAVYLVDLLASSPSTDKKVAARIREQVGVVQRIIRAAADAGYRVETFRELVAQTGR